MVRAASYTADDFINAAIELIAEGGPSAATIAAIARKTGAPTGSVYHRFCSRAAVVLQAWLRVQGQLLMRLEQPLRSGDARGVVQELFAWARACPREARFLLLNEPDGLCDAAPPAEVQQRLEAQDATLLKVFRAFVEQRAGAASEESEATWRFLLFDGPVALLRPYLLEHRDIPEYIEQLALRLPEAVPTRLAAAS